MDNRHIKIIILSAVASFVLAFYIIGMFLFLGPRLAVVIIIKTQFDKETMPSAYLTPIERKISIGNPNSTDTAEYSYENMRFKTSFGKVLKIDKSNHSYMYTFDHSQYVYVCELNNHIREIFISLADEDEKYAQYARSLYGDEVIDSNYHAHKLILETSPDNIGILSSRKDIALAMSLSICKALMVSDGAHSIYHFETSRIKGFQEGEPLKSKGISILVFDSDDSDNRAYEIYMHGKKVTQKDIDYLISSIEIEGKKKVIAASK